MPHALVIGASRGIGRECVRQLLEAGWRVYATVRDDAALTELQAAGAIPFKVDVAKPETLAALGWQLDGERLDLAVYVAGVTGPLTGAHSPPSTAEFDRVMHTNALGAMQAIPLIAPMVEAAQGKFVFISSELGSIGSAQSSFAWIYRTSKAALDMAVRAASFDYPNAVFAVLSPGWVRTEMGGAEAPLTAQQSVRSMLTVVEKLQRTDSGDFFSHTGTPLPW